jgi:PDZ domain-containing secreted protein
MRSAQLFGLLKEFFIINSLYILHPDYQEDVTTVVRVVDQSKSASQGFHSSSTVKKNDESSGLGSVVTTVFESSRELVPQSYAGDATHTTEVDTAHDR